MYNYALVVHYAFMYIQQLSLQEKQETYVHLIESIVILDGIAGIYVHDYHKHDSPYFCHKNIACICKYKKRPPNILCPLQINIMVRVTDLYPSCVQSGMASSSSTLSEGRGRSAATTASRPPSLLSLRDREGGEGRGERGGREGGGEGGRGRDTRVLCFILLQQGYTN